MPVLHCWREHRTDNLSAHGAAPHHLDRASLSTAALPAGDQTITASYSGDSTYLTGQPATMIISVRSTPQSATAPAIGTTNLPLAAVAGVASHFTAPITVVGQAPVLKGLFVVQLHAAPGDTLDGATFLGFRRRRAGIVIPPYPKS